MSRNKGQIIEIDAMKCAGCLTCELRCSLRFEKAFNPTRAQIKIRRLIESPCEFTSVRLPPALIPIFLVTNGSDEVVFSSLH